MKCKNLDEFNFPECKGWITAISITILVLGFIVSLAFTLQSMYIRFYHPDMQVDGRKDIFFKIAEWYHKIKAAREQEKLHSADQIVLDAQERDQAAAAAGALKHAHIRSSELQISRWAVCGMP